MASADPRLAGRVFDGELVALLKVLAINLKFLQDKQRRLLVRQEKLMAREESLMARKEALQLREEGGRVPQAFNRRFNVISIGTVNSTQKGNSHDES